MSQLAIKEQSIDESGARPLLLVGNPNVGKSLLFTRLTNRYVTVSNYPGTTVEMTTATAIIGDVRRSIIDTPGINSLLPQSEDEIVARDLLLRETNIDVMQVGDIANLRRTLLLTLQLCEYAVPFVVALNMADELRSVDDGPNVAALSRAIGVPVVSVSALRRWNISKLKQELGHAARGTTTVTYPAAIEAGITAIRALLKPALATRGVALSILAGDATLKPLLAETCPAIVLEQLDDLRAFAQRGLARPISVLISHCRVAAVDELLASLRQSSEFREDGLRDRLGRICMHPIYGIPILLGVLALAWLLVGKIGAGTLVDLLQRQVFERFLNPWTIRGIDFIAPFPHHHVIADGAITSAYSGHAVTMAGRIAQTIHDLVVGPYGVVTMAITYAIAIVLPVVITFFTFFGLLEDSGYLPRLAVILHRGFRKIGLNGKAVLPMVLGLGCDTMATLTTRILDSKKEATIVTLLLALGVPCSAQLGVILAMLAPLGAPATLIWGGVTLLTILLAGWAASRVVPGEPGDFVLEIPPMRVPRLSNILIKVAARTEWYLKEAVPLFIVGTLLLYGLDATGALKFVQRALGPLIIGGLGLPAEATNAFVIGFLRRDYGAAGLYAMQRAGHLNPNQVVIALTVITLFIPCIANLLVMLKERGARMGWAIAGFIIVYSFGIGALMNVAFRFFGVSL
ncbi:MAG TPA: ferrous iron transport protein B [Thermoanaerobaculia bacterium]|jgi:ferrous iron transport protein B|nr:ferrous iron transport protein B [Thermoanaerobaculia bacterium]